MMSRRNKRCGKLWCDCTMHHFGALRYWDWPLQQKHSPYCLCNSFLLLLATGTGDGVTERREEKCCARFTTAPQLPVALSKIAANVPQASDEFRLLLFSGLVGSPKPIFRETLWKWTMQSGVRKHNACTVAVAKPHQSNQLQMRQ